MVLLIVERFVIWMWADYIRFFFKFIILIKSFDLLLVDQKLVLFLQIVSVPLRIG